jgi:hypothetical protein
MPVFCRPVKVTQADNATSFKVVFGDFVSDQLNLRASIGAISLTEATLDAIFDEIWNADVNAGLVATQGSRAHIPPSDSRTRSFELVPEEWVVLPIMPPTLPDWTLQALPVMAGDDIDATCTKIVAFCKASNLQLPPLPGPWVAGSNITADALRENFFNAQLRRGSTADVVYFFTADAAATPADVPPSTDAGGGVTVSVKATPDWLVPFLHYIDRMKAEAYAHSQAYESLRNLVADGKVAVEALNVADNAMTLLEGQVVPAPPTNILGKALDRIGRSSYPLMTQKLDIADFHAKLRALRDLAQTEYVDNANFPQKVVFQSSLTALAGIENEAAFARHYAKFDAARAAYPVTAHAYQIACASYIAARVLHPDSDPYTGNILDVFDKGTAGTTPVSMEVTHIFNGTTKMNDAAALAAMTVGNAPGPSTLWLWLTKLSLIRQIKNVPPGAGGSPGSVNKNAVLFRYVRNLATSFGIPESTLTDWGTTQSKLGLTPTPEARAVSARMAALNGQASSVQSGPLWMAPLSLLDLWGLFSAMADAKKDHGLAAAADAGSAATSAANFVGAVSQGLAGVGDAAAASTRTGLLGKAATILGAVLGDATTLGMLTKTASVFGLIASFGGAIVGGIQIAQGIRDGDLVKVAAGAGAVLTSFGFWIGEYATARAPLLFARSATAEILGITFTEVGLVELGACLGLIGVLISIVALAAMHWDAITTFVAKQVTPGARQFVDVLLAKLGGANVLSAGPAGVRTALDAAVAAAAAAKFSVWFHDFDQTDDLPTLKLRAIRMSEDDIKIFGAWPVDRP